MRSTIKFIIFLCVGLTVTSCVSKKKFVSLQDELAAANKDLGKCGVSLNEALAKLTTCEKEKENARIDLSACRSTLQLREEQMQDLRTQIEDFKVQRNALLEQVGSQTVLSQSANENIRETMR